MPRQRAKDITPSPATPHQRSVLAGRIFLARRRHLNALQAAQTELDNAILCAPQQIELLAEHLRLAQLALSEITGEFSADDLLGVIFSRFCIGK